ncbi:hypothetical protein JR065_06755 [Xanthomonas sp. AmX2]|uniref:hypothetical protein n=1 Tax=Xanthomonas sp. TaxID=29446 RepID=UPI00197D85F7|nr:hypothetical protein [Xanthomonas sp.]MBN6150034.1 hypothetical protein [Xanthomonas sp.]
MPVFKFPHLVRSCAIAALLCAAIGSATAQAQATATGRAAAEAAAAAAARVAAEAAIDATAEATSIQAHADATASAAADECPAAQFDPQAEPFAGHYYLSGIRETGSELLLRPDGRFQWMLAYGAVDQSAQGRWWRAGDCIGLAPDPRSGQSPFVLLRPEDGGEVREMFDEWRQYAPAEHRSKLPVYVVEREYRMSTSGIVATLRWADGQTREAVVDGGVALFAPRAQRPVALRLRHPELEPGDWIALDAAAPVPLMVDFRLSALMDAPPLPTRLRIDGDTLLPTWPGRGERGRYAR